MNPKRLTKPNRHAQSPSERSNGDCALSRASNFASDTSIAHGAPRPNRTVAATGVSWKPTSNHKPPTANC